MPNVAGESLATRDDPWDKSSVYVLLKDGWVRAICRSLYGLGQLTEVEKRALTAEYNSRLTTPADDEQHAQRLREFLRVFKPEGALALEFERQSENKDLYTALHMANIEPIVAPHRSVLVGEPPAARRLASEHDSSDGASLALELDADGAAPANLDDFADL